MWTAKNRRRYDRSALRYPSDLTDEEWAHVDSLIPPARRGGNKRHVDVREVMNGIMYVLSTGCQWRAIPKDLPSVSLSSASSTNSPSKGAVKMFTQALARDLAPDGIRVCRAFGPKAKSLLRNCPADAADAPLRGVEGDACVYRVMGA